MADSIQFRLDQVALLRRDRLALQKQVDEMKAKEDSEAAAIAREMLECGISELQGDVGKIKLKTVESAEVTDYHALYEYIRETNSFDLLQRRVSLSGVRERWQKGNDVPGVARVLEDSYTLSIPK